VIRDLRFYQDRLAELEFVLQQNEGMDDDWHEMLENSVAFCHRKIAEIKRRAKYAQYLRVRREIIARN
jgi:hypothetical protein